MPAKKGFTDPGAIRKVAAVSLSMSQRDRHMGLSTCAEFDLTDQLSLERAIKRSQDFLLKAQKPEGYWIGELMVDSTLVSDTIAYHHWNVKVDPVCDREAVIHM